MWRAMLNSWRERAVNLALHLRHQWGLNHETVVECQPGEVFVRCRTCGLRTEARIVTGPLRVKARLPGNPCRRRPIVHVPVDVPVLEFRRRRR
jgi:hypothetical protein